MHVFVTGGTGTIGSSVIAELLAHGHTVLALARSDESDKTLREAGAEVLRGDLSDQDVLREGVTRTDGVISLAFSRDYSSADAVAAGVAQETTAMETLGEALVGTGKPIVTPRSTCLRPYAFATSSSRRTSPAISNASRAR